MFLNSQMHELLISLDQAKQRIGTEWVASSSLRHFPTQLRQEAQRRGYTEGRGNTTQREYRLLPAGRTALANNAQANLDVMPEIEKGFVPVGDIDVVPTGESAVAHPPKIAATVNVNHIGEVNEKVISELPKIIDENFRRVMRDQRFHLDADFIPPPDREFTEKNIDITKLDKAIAAAQARDQVRARACVRAIDILAEDFPEVTDLVDSLMRLEQRKVAADE